MSSTKYGSVLGHVSLCDTAGDQALLVAQLKSALLAKDSRIEQLELTNRRLADQLAAMSGRVVEEANAASVSVDPDDRLHENADVRPSQVGASAHAGEQVSWPMVKIADGSDWQLPISSDFVVTVAPARGIYSDNWTERLFAVTLLSDRPLRECTLELWLKPESREILAEVIVRVDANAPHAARVEFGQLNTIKFPIDVAAKKIFVLGIACDYIKPLVPPDQRLLSYVLRSLTFV